MNEIEQSVTKGQPICFVVMQIGEEGSEVRRYADDVYEFLIIPALEDRYQMIRADQIAKPGNINRQIVAQLVDADLVVADLTDQNPNVFYELALRHALRKAYVQIIGAGQPIPFDVKTERTISYDLKNPRSTRQAMSEIRKYVEAVERDPTIVQSPLEQAVEFKPIQDSTDLYVKSNLDILNAIEELREDIKLPVTQAQARFPSPPIAIARRASEIFDQDGDLIDPKQDALTMILNGFGKPMAAANLLRMGFRSDEVTNAVDWAANEYAKAVEVYEEPIKQHISDPFADKLMPDPFAER